MPKPKRFIDGKQFPLVMKKISKAMKPYAWCLIGGRAVEVHTNPPQTPDIDILYDALDVDGTEVVDALEAAGISLNENYRKGDIIFMLDRKENVEVDVLPTYDPLATAAIYSATIHRIGGVDIPVVSPEDLIILKAQILSDFENGSVSRGPDKLKRDTASILALAARDDVDLKWIMKTLRGEGWDDEIRILKRLGVLQK